MRHPTSSVASTVPPFTSSATSSAVPIQSSAIPVASFTQTTMNLMPTSAYQPMTMTGNTLQNTLFTSAVLPSAQQSQQQQQQPLPQSHPIFISGNASNFFLTHPSPVGATPVMLAPGQHNTPGTFVMAQPVPAATSTPNAGAPSTPNCIFRLPDGRFIMSASNVARLPGTQPTYFPVSMSSGQASSGGGTSSLAQQPPLGVLAPTPGQAFYIQVPPSVGGFGGTVFATNCSTASSPLQSQPNMTFKLAQSGQYVSSMSTNSRPPILMTPSPIPFLPTQGVYPPKVSTPSNPCLSVGSSQPECVQTVQAPSELYSIGGNGSSVNVTHPIGFPGGVAVTRLPNGAFAAVPYTRPQSPLTLTNCVTSMMNDSTSVTVAGATGTRKGTSRSSSKQTSNTSNRASVLQQLDEQIGAIQGISNPSEDQLTTFKQLIDVRQQLSKTSNSDFTDSKVTATHNSFSQNPCTASLELALRREILDTLSRNNLLPKVTSQSITDTFLVEFRLNLQRYQLRLTKQQKFDFERLLFSVSSERQAEILTVLQQEQNRLFNIRSRPPSITTSVSPLTTVCSSGSAGFTPKLQPQQFRLAPNMPSVPSVPLQSATFGTSQGLRFVAARQMMPPPGLSNAIIRGGQVTMCPTTPVVGVVAALPMPSVPGSGSNTSMFTPNVASALPVPNSERPHCVSGPAPGGIFLSPSLPPGAQTFVMHQPVIVPSCTIGATMLPVSCSLTPLAQSQHSDSSSMHPQLSQSPSITPSVTQNVRSTPVPSKQASRAARIRAHLISDLKSSTEKPSLAEPDGSTCLPSHLRLLEALAPYHVHQDADNTEEAMRKVDQILEDASALLVERKRRVIEAVHAQLYRDTMNKLESHLEERLILGRMALDLDRDTFEAEKSAFRDSIRDIEDLDDLQVHSTIKKLAQSTSDVSAANQFVQTLGSACPNNGSSTCVNGSRSVDRRHPRSPSYLRHPTSSLSSPWLTLLGPLAYLRPLVFDEKGNGKFATVTFPALSEEGSPLESLENNQMEHISMSVQSVSGSPSCENRTGRRSDGSSYTEGRCSPIVAGERENEESSDDSEADLLLGLDVRQARRGPNDHGLTSNGIMHSRCTSLTEVKEVCGDSVAFDETYDLWQELMREEGMDMDEMDSSSCLDNAPPSVIPEESSKKSMLLLDNNGSFETTSGVQHSEDPDIDAAIRSILSTSN